MQLFTESLVIHVILFSINWTVRRAIILTIDWNRSGARSWTWPGFGSVSTPRASSRTFDWRLTSTPGSRLALIFIVAFRRLWSRLRSRARLRTGRPGTRSRFTSTPWLRTSSWMRSWAGSGSRPPATSFIFNHFNTSSVKISSVQLFESILHIGIRGKIHDSHISFPFMCVSISHFSRLSHKIF